MIESVTSRTTSKAPIESLLGSSHWARTIARLSAVVSLFLLVPIAALLHAQDVGGSSAVATQDPRPNIQFPFLRYDEDWTFLCDSSRRVEFWDRLKYLPMNGSGSAYISLGGESRQVYEWYHNQYWGAGPQDNTAG